MPGGALPPAGGGGGDSTPTPGGAGALIPGGGGAGAGEVPAGASDSKIRVFSLGGSYDYGDNVVLPPDAVTSGGASLWIIDGIPIAAKPVKECDLEDFMSLVARQDARILPITRGRHGRRYKSWLRVSEDCEEVDMADWPLPGTRTTSWCVDYLVLIGQTIESHHEDFVRRCKLERNSWGVHQHWQATNFVSFLA